MWLLHLLTKPQWSDNDIELKGKLFPTHFGLANNVISPQQAGIEIATTMRDFLKDKPEFVAEMGKNKGYTKNQPQTLNEAKSMKSDL